MVLLWYGTVMVLYTRIQSMLTLLHLHPIQAIPINYQEYIHTRFAALRDKSHNDVRQELTQQFPILKINFSPRTLHLTVEIASYN